MARLLRQARRLRSCGASGAEDEFVSWLREGGAEFEKLAIRQAEFGRGVVATADYTTGETLLAVPERLLLTVGVASAREDVEEALVAAKRKGVCLNDGNFALALFLANDRSDEWRPYRAGPHT